MEAPTCGGNIVLYMDPKFQFLLFLIGTFCTAASVGGGFTFNNYIQSLNIKGNGRWGVVETNQITNTNSISSERVPI